MRADGSLVPVEVVVVPAYVKGRVILTAYIRDLSERRRGERMATARQRATQALTASLSLAEAAPAVLDALVQGLGCTEARLWVAEGDPPALVLAGTSSGATAAPVPAPPDDALARRTLEEGAAAWAGPSVSGSGVDLAVPVRVGGQVLGVLEVMCAAARSRDADWVCALADVGSLLALFLRRQRTEADLHRFARYDSLTGLPNRSFFLETLERTLSRAGRQRARSALVFVDLDGFKAVNDGLGHAAGDAVLQTMAERLRAGTRSSDLVARIGGDEFTVLVQNLSRADDAALVARGLLDRLARPCVADDHEVALSASAGISVYPEDGTDADTLLRNADLAMYRAKQDGQEHLPLLHRGDERARPRADAPPRQPPGGARAGRVRDRLPAGAAPGPPPVARGPPAVAAPQARPRHARLVHRPGRGERAHPPDRGRGPARGHPLRRLARAQGRRRRGEPLGPAVPPAQPGRHRRGGPATQRPSRPPASSSTSPSQRS
jgi:diguanylate cyclase (GGDEF)-like protein